MRNTIIGTAGHVDHGKTRLIKALTGIETDRLKEEKKRGITIELGFAHFDMSDGQHIGIVDVPGHEKFIRNMLAGAGGIEIAMLIVAADEGFMPQTREHLDILTLLDVRKGIVVITKSDLVDSEWLELMQMEIESEVAGTFLEKAPIMVVSANTGDGIPELRSLIEEMVRDLPLEEGHVSFRIPIDRVFTVDGFGTIITGTLLEGSLSVGDEIEVYPRNMLTKARSVQVHNESVEIAYPGQRVAVNLPGIKHYDVSRGDVLSRPGKLAPTHLLDTKVTLLSNCNRTIKNNSSLHFHHGSRSVLCKITLIDTEELHAGETGYAQLRLGEEVVIKQGDRFVLRFYSPLETIGGGIILDIATKKHKRNDKKTIAGFIAKDTENLSGKILQMVFERCPDFPTVEQLSNLSKKHETEVVQAIDLLIEQGLLLKIQPNFLIHPAYISKLAGKAQTILKEYHRDEPLQPGMRKNIFASKLLPSLHSNISDQILGYLEKEKCIRLVDQQTVADMNFSATISEAHKKMSETILNTYLSAGFATPSTDEIQQVFSKAKKQFIQTFEALIYDGSLVMLTPQICLHQSFFSKAMAELVKIGETQGSFTLGEFRDKLGTSRKYAVAFLEYCDRKGYTKKEGDLRSIINK